MTFLKHTVHTTGSTETIGGGFIFTKWHAMALALTVGIIMVASYFFQQWLATGSLETIFKQLSSVPIPFRKEASPSFGVVAKECSPEKPFFSDEGNQCTELCPAPTIPDESGHCINK
jgi:hypothetical protein